MSIAEADAENIRSKPATAGLPPWGVILIYIGQCGSYAQMS